MTGSDPMNEVARPSKTSSFEADIARIEQIRRVTSRPYENASRDVVLLNGDCIFLLKFIDKLWKEYTSALTAPKTAEPCPHEDCHAAWRCTRCGEFRGECPPVHAPETPQPASNLRALLQLVAYPGPFEGRPTDDQIRLMAKSELDRLPVETRSEPDGSARCPHCHAWRTAEETGKGMCCDKDVPSVETKANHLWLGPGVTYPCGCRSSGPRYEAPWYCAEHNRVAQETTAHHAMWCNFGKTGAGGGLMGCNCGVQKALAECRGCKEGWHRQDQWHWDSIGHMHECTAPNGTTKP